MTGTADDNAAAEKAPTDGLAARRAAYKILNDIFFQRRSMDEALVRTTEFEKLPARDRSFVRLLVSIVLKRSAQMDAALSDLLHEPLENLKPPQLVNIFRLGIAQRAFLETPPHAVVNTTVALAEAEGITHHKPLVNAVMRRMVSEGLPPMDARDAGRMNTPDWLWREWMRDYGVETALDIAAANFDEAAIDVSVKSQPEQWAETLESVILPTGSLRRKTGGFIPDLPGFTQGAWWIQGAAAALPALLLLSPLPPNGGRGRDPLPLQREGEGLSRTADSPGQSLTLTLSRERAGEGITVVDLCAAPGGKTAQLAAMGAHVIAVDRSAERVKRLHENMERLKFDAEVAVADGAAWQPKENVDAVLIDAPCTATGTIRHQPDVLHLKEMKDQEKMAALQRRLLLNAFSMLKPGGVMVYCTCSLQHAEGEDQTTWFLQQGLPAQLSPISKEEIPGIAEMLTPRGELRCLPQHWKDMGGMDGFYAVRFIKQIF